MASLSDFQQIDLRVGKIIEVGEIEGAIKPLYRLKVDLGELGTRNIAAGIKNYYTPEQLLNRNIIVIANLEPKNVANFISEGMLLAGDDENGISLLSPDRELKPGTKIR
jgi:methionine--tRNA ligase beta chain